MRISDWSSDVCSSDLSFGYEIIDEHADSGEGERSFQLFGLPMTATRDTTDDPLDPRSGTRLLFSLTPTTGVGSENLLFLTSVAGGSAYYAIDEDERFVLAGRARVGSIVGRSEEHTSELPSLMRISSAVFCLKNKHTTNILIQVTNTMLNNY